MEKFPKPIQHAAEYALEDDSIPKFTVWSFGSKTNRINRVLREHRGSNTGLFQFWTATRKEKNALVYTLN